MQRPTNLNDFAKVVHQANFKWWQNIDTGEPIKRNPKELLMLIISEVAECLEGERKNLMDDKLPHRKMAEVEMADTVIRVLDFSCGFNYALVFKSNYTFITPNNKGEGLFNIVSKIVYTEYFILAANPHVGDILSSVIEMIEDYCTKYGYDLWGAIDDKMKYNAIRQDHTHEARRKAGGKQF